MNSYAFITEQVLKDLRGGLVPWRKAWTLNPSVTVNYISRKEYSLLNRLVLPKGGEYLTLKQLTDLGASLRPSGLTEAELDDWGVRRYSGRRLARRWTELPYEEKDRRYQADTLRHTVTFFKWVLPDEASDEIEADREAVRVDDGRRYPVLRFYDVYHVDDVVGLPAKGVESGLTEMSFDAGRTGRLLKGFCEAEGVTILEGDTQEPRYDRDSRTVYVPTMRCFGDQAYRYPTLLREVAMAAARCPHVRAGRGLSDGKFELAADMAGAMLSVRLGLYREDVWNNQMAGAARWIPLLEADSQAVVRAAALAERIMDHVMRFDRTAGQEAA